MDFRGTSFYHLHKLRNWISLCGSSIFTRIWAACKGVEFGKSLRAKGIPYFYRIPHSAIRIGNNCSIWSSFRSNNIGSMSRSRICTQTPDAQILIGNQVGMSSISISSHLKIEIGDQTIIGAGTVITDSDWHNPDPMQRTTSTGNPKPIHIGKNVFIGTRSIILKGVTIGDNSVIGAGSVVTNDIPANVIAAGNPCHVIKPL